MENAYVIVGLGNPGPRYLMTRHNVGFMSLDLWAQKENIPFTAKKDFDAEYAELEWKGKKLFLLKPQTFMNLSGQSIRKLYSKKSFLKEAPLLVLHDEVDIPFGRLKIKFGGGDAGNNGLRSIRSELGTGDFYRLRIGVGKPPQGSPMDLADYVLQRFPKSDENELADMLIRSHNVLECFLEKGLHPAQEESARR